MLKTFFLTPNQIERIELSGGKHVVVKNVGEVTVFVSRFNTEYGTRVEKYKRFVCKNISKFGTKDNKEIGYFGCMYAFSEEEGAMIEVHTIDNDDLPYYTNCHGCCRDK